MKEFYINFETYKVKDFGTPINEDLIYTKNSGEYIVYHIPTGKKVKSGKRLKSLIKEVIIKLEEEKIFVQNMVNKTNLEILPIGNIAYSIEREIITTLKIKEIPIDSIVFNVKRKFEIDFVKLDCELMKKKKYNHELSLNENIVNLYGEAFLNTLENYSINPFDIAM